MDRFENSEDKKGQTDPKSWEAEMERQRAYAEKKAKETAGNKPKDSKEQKRQDRQQQRQQQQQQWRSQREAQRQKSNVTVGSILKSSLLWGLCIFCLLFGMLSAMTPINAYFVISGIDLIVLSVLACPFVTKRTKEWPSLEGFYKYKRWIVAALIIFTLLSMYLAGSRIS